MVFSSQVFIFYFLPLALAVYYLAPCRLKNFVLTVSSYVFYGWANPLFVIPMFATSLVDYACGLAIATPAGSRWWGTEPLAILTTGTDRSLRQKVALGISVGSNLCLLGFFKYWNFGIESYNSLLDGMGLQGAQWQTSLRVALPLGISFYTFQTMSYSIDVFRGDARAMRNLNDFCCFVSMFPQLVAGPIIRFQELADQLRERTHTAEKFARGAAFFCFGMAKKILLANPCGKVADLTFDAGSVVCADAWFGALAYAFQIYFDFSGYSDMAIGLGLLLGFTFPKNFDSPYLADSITDFWRRWHISLSTWLRDYLYIPLGGNRLGTFRTYLNLAVVMLLGGLWHGAAWNFVIWGGLHGGLLIAERACPVAIGRRLPRPLRILLTFTVVCFTWVFFRSPGMTEALRFCGSMCGFCRSQPAAGLLGGVIYQPYYVLSLLLAAAVVWLAPQTWDYTGTLTTPKLCASFGVFWLSIVMLTTQSYNPFIYFIF